MSIKRRKRATIRAALAVLLLGLSAGNAAAAERILIQDRYIVVLNQPSGLIVPSLDTQIRSLVSMVGGGEVIATYGTALRGFAVKMSAAQAGLMAALPGVKLVEQDSLMQARGTQTGATWGLDRVDQRALPLNGSYSYPTNAGQGVNVYVVDTGLNASHTEFAGRIGNGRNFAPNDDGTLGQALTDFGLNPAQLGVPLNVGALDLGSGLFEGPTDPNDTTDCNGHGTHVSGTTAGTTYGVAKKAKIHSVRVLGCSGSGSNAGVIAGVDWVAANAQLPAVANMSLGGGDSAALDMAVQNAIDAGVTFVVAAGNSNADACSGSPNKLPAAITVGAATKADSRDTGYSNYGSCVDLFAPGTDITSSWIGSSSATNTISGTSMASPHVAGAAALVLSAHPSATPADVVDTLLGDATLGVLSNVGSGSPNTLLYVVH
ncbi:S8 family peptidase [Sinimarinibacterium sp. CAU 1509]|uniref:S8 family peptidase n=1 Tax=Sinimarinibacterium sp. CAU 1509 TaxID=2562283 RepID=UPI0010ACBB6E|nr:S8 family peptidase [Sinimarinibacterium sp. CAU 1509]TJY62895.1 S8 family peptidase [Sinimarinibacterium sp. CAU 1509]